MKTPGLTRSAGPALSSRCRKEFTDQCHQFRYFRSELQFRLRKVERWTGRSKADTAVDFREHSRHGVVRYPRLNQLAPKV
jgi:hypothetical protein